MEINKKPNRWLVVGITINPCTCKVLGKSALTCRSGGSGDCRFISADVFLHPVCEMGSLACTHVTEKALAIRMSTAVCQAPLCSPLQYDFVELLDGSRLIAREQRNLLESERAGRQTRSVSLHEAGFIQYLDSGIWHLAFYNDGKNAEQVSFNTIIIGKHHLQSSHQKLGSGCEVFSNLEISFCSPVIFFHRLSIHSISFATQKQMQNIYILFNWSKAQAMYRLIKQCLKGVCRRQVFAKLHRAVF